MAVDSCRKGCQVLRVRLFQPSSEAWCHSPVTIQALYSTWTRASGTWLCTMMGRRRSRCPFSLLRSVSTVLNGNFALNNAKGVTLNVQMVIDSQMTYVKEHLYILSDNSHVFWWTWKCDSHVVGYMTHSNLAAEIQSYAQPAIIMANLAVSNLLSFLFLPIPIHWDGVAV